jgi:uncharacterized protein (TIGR02246 family)
VKRTVAAVAAIAIGFSTFSFASRGQSSDSQPDEEAIRKVVVLMTEGFNNHDASAATQMYRPAARLVTVRGQVMDGRPAIEAGLASIFATRAKSASHRTLDVAVKFIRPDVALVYVTNELSGLVALDSQALPAHQELSLRVFVKESGTWSVAAFQNTMIRPFGAP